MVREHFTKEEINNEWKAICKHCNRKLDGDSKNGTKHLHVHLGRCNKQGQLDIRQQVLTALTYKDVFLRCVQLHDDPLYKHLPTEDDWTFAAKICEKLNLFYERTEDFLGTKYSIANFYFPHICSIRVALNEWAQDSNATISSMARRMFAKFEKYWRRSKK
ncbi:hypothetical protein V6N12_065417 [Hibiscus sabdariffa]|uniref:hAT-like transposase RNase-H fold domain-containing protein n=1 Tax=Hibiscus sabdariffa TaxID=183260 RepID=A0ABR2G8M2_9ROSI